MTPSTTISREELNALKSRVGMEPYKSRLGSLEESGSEFRAFCPWHEKGANHNPSLAIYRSKENPEHFCFKCMSQCKAKQGDVICFVQLVDGLSFAGAVRKITEECGESKPAPIVEDLTSENTVAAREYLTKQGVSLEVAKQSNVSCVMHPKLGLAVAFPYDVDANIVKYRAVKPKDKNSKFSHKSGHPSEMHLFNIMRVESALKESFGDNVFVVESERDALMMESHGYLAVSVSSATASVDRDGSLKILPEQLEILAKADNVILALDQDPAGQDCANAFEKCSVFGPAQVKRLTWPYGGKRSKQPKDVGDLYLENPTDFRAKMDTLAQEAIKRPPLWRQAFSTVGELDDAPIISLIEGFVTEGNIGLGGLSGHGKTFIALSLARALTTGKPFVGHFKVNEVRPVLYLVPEVNDRQFNRRARYFGIPDDENLFLVRTLSHGTTLPLSHPHVLTAVKNLHHPVVILDTAIRFSTAQEENSAVENKWMEAATRGLREAGAIAVILLHHSPKSSVNEYPTLENTFRGSSDIGALFDMAYCIRREPEAPGLQIKLTNVKERDEDSPLPFTLGLKYLDQKTGEMRSFIEETGDLAYMEYLPEATTDEERFSRFVTNNPKLSFRELADKLGKKGPSTVARLAKRAGWTKPENGIWKQLSTDEYAQTDELEDKALEPEPF